MNRFFYPAAALFLLAAAGCGSGTGRTGDGQGKEAARTGGDRDEHGCITSAGYVWSEVRNDCIRCFEIGVKMLSATDTAATQAAYIVFSADSTRAELFLPGEDKHEILDRRKLPGGGYAWNVEDDDTKNVRKENGAWIIEQRGKVLYRQDPATVPVTASFTGGDGKTKRLYRVGVTFYPAFERAVLDYDGQAYHLKQYVTADGYGYRNDSIDLRGKGTEATLSFKDGATLSLRQNTNTGR